MASTFSGHPSSPDLGSTQCSRVKNAKIQVNHIIRAGHNSIKICSAPGVLRCLRRRACNTVARGGGTYRIVGRVIAPTGNDDSFRGRFQGPTTNTANHDSGWIRWGLETGDDRHDMPVRGMDDENQTVWFTVAAGLYNLEIAYREDGALLDAWMIAQQPE